jgi:DNA-binding response OmpR family regulator
MVRRPSRTFGLWKKPRYAIQQRRKIIMTTALDDMKNIVESFQSLCDAYLFKPIDTRKSRDHIRSLNLLSAQPPRPGEKREMQTVEPR